MTRVSPPRPVRSWRGPVGAAGGSTPTDEINGSKRILDMPSEIELFGDGEGVVNLDAEIPDSAFELAMAEQELNRPQIARLPIDLSCFGAAHRMRSVGRAVEASLGHPSMDEAGILPGREMRLASSGVRGKQITRR